MATPRRNRPRVPESIALDLRYAWRTMLRSPGFALPAILILALGIGANTAVFSLVSTVLLKPLPFVEPDRLVLLWEDFSALGGPPRVEAAPASFAEWRERSTSFEGMAAFQTGTYNLTGDGEPERIFGVRTTPNLFSVLGLQPILGRTFTAEDEGPGATPVAVIGEDFWMRRFGGDPGIIGRSIVLGELSRTVIGVVPPDFKFPSEETAVWLPAQFTPDELSQRDAYFMYVVARLEPSTPLSVAQAEMSAIARTIARERGADGVVGASVVPLHEQLARDVRPMLYVLLAAVVAVLLMTCGNAANLLLARGTIRRRELALRRVLGARRGRVFRQLLTESGLLLLLGGMLGVALSILSFEYLARLVPGTFPAGTSPELDLRVLAFTSGIALVTVLLFGTGPALVAAHRQINDALRSGAGRATRCDGRMRNALVIGEIALTVVLLTAAGLLLRSYTEVLEVDPGFRPENLLIAETPLPASKYSGLQARAAFYDRVVERVSAIPGVEGASYVNFAPLVFDGGRSLITIDGQPAPPPEEFARYITSNRVVSDEYLSMLGVPLISGRHIDARDSADAPRAVVINEAMAALHWPGENAIGARLRFGNDQTEFGSPWYTVVGIVGDVSQVGLDEPPLPEMYLSYRQPPSPSPFLWPRQLLVRTAGDPMGFARAVQAAVWEADPDQPVSNIRTMDDVFDAELLNRNTQMTLIGAFAALALLLAAVGLYSVLSYTVAQRTSEIGLRMALGARSGNVIRAVTENALRLTAAGLALGLVSAFVVTRLLESFLFGVSPTDFATFAGVVVVLVGVTIFASYVPARRAARVSPMVALRTE